MKAREVIRKRVWGRKKTNEEIFFLGRYQSAVRYVTDTRLVIIPRNCSKTSRKLPFEGPRTMSKNWPEIFFYYLQMFFCNSISPRMDCGLLSKRVSHILIPFDPLMILWTCLLRSMLSSFSVWQCWKILLKLTFFSFQRGFMLFLQPA